MHMHGGCFTSSFFFTFFPLTKYIQKLLSKWTSASSEMKPGGPYTCGTCVGGLRTTYPNQIFHSKKVFEIYQDVWHLKV